MAVSVTRGDIRGCWLGDPGIGAEISSVPKNRPVVVVSADEQNSNLRNQVVVVVPLTTLRDGRGPRRDEIVVEPWESGLSVRSVTICNQVRAVDRLRLGRRIGHLSDGTMSAISKCLESVLAIGSARHPS